MLCRNQTLRPRVRIPLLSGQEGLLGGNGGRGGGVRKASEGEEKDPAPSLPGTAGVLLTLVLGS